MMKIVDRQFVCHFWFVAWDCFSLGLHVSLRQPNVEIHLPFGFVKVGWHGVYLNDGRHVRRSFGRVRRDMRAFSRARRSRTPSESP